MSRVGVLLCVSTACPGDDEPTGSGTGGDEDMPEVLDPGPGGPSCAEKIGMRPGWTSEDPTAASQPGTVGRVVPLGGDAALETDVEADPVGTPMSPLSTEPLEFRATTIGPHVHERWGDFDVDGCHDIAWFDSVGDMLHVWRCLPGMRDFDCGATIPTPPDAAPVGMHWGF